jgi:hypothetical protein
MRRLLRFCSVCVRQENGGVACVIPSTPNGCFFQNTNAAVVCENEVLVKVSFVACCRLLFCFMILTFEILCAVYVRRPPPHPSLCGYYCLVTRSWHSTRRPLAHPAPASIGAAAGQKARNDAIEKMKFEIIQ